MVIGPSTVFLGARLERDWAGPNFAGSGQCEIHLPMHSMQASPTSAKLRSHEMKMIL